MVASSINPQTYQQVKPYLFSVAYRMTGSASDAEDLVQDAWMRYLDAGAPDVDSLQAWLTTTISRLSLDYLKSARVKREEYPGSWLPEPVLTREAIAGPEAMVERREAVSMAFLTLLEQLSPEQRVVYVLREGLGLTYDEIAGKIDKSAAACRQIFHRAQRRISVEQSPQSAPAAECRQLAERFLVAFGTGNAEELTALLAEDVSWLGDGGPQRLASRRPVVGCDRVVKLCTGLAAKMPPSLEPSFEIAELNGAPAVVMFNHGKVDRVFVMDVRDGKIAAVRMVCNLEKLAHLARSLGRELGESFEPAPKRQGASPGGQGN